MALTDEDKLRLNVLLATELDAVRIDENRMYVCALRGDTDVNVALHPNCRPEQYLKQVREFLSGHVLGSPGGYPVYLKRWTRMGQAKGESLGDLLLLGEPEAVVAVACAHGLTDELARRAWWIAQDPENARRMLERDAVVQGEMGRILADFLVEFLPFESEPTTIMRSVRLVLQPGLIDEATRSRIWEKGRAKNVYRVGFLQATPDELPEQRPSRGDYSAHHATLTGLATQGNGIARLLDKVLSGPGQTFLQTSHDIMKKPANQDVVIALLEAIGRYFGLMSPGHESTRDIGLLLARTDAYCAAPSDEYRAVVAAAPELEPELRAMVTLGQVDEAIVLPVFATSTAIGSLMRRRIEPITTPLFHAIDCLLGKRVQ